MPNEARHHHFIPKFYLRGFAVRGKKYWSTTVFSLEGAEPFETNIRNVGGIKDFNRVEVAGFPPDIVESEMAKWETEVAVRSGPAQLDSFRWFLSDGSAG